MPQGFYKTFDSSDPQKFRIAKGSQLVGLQDTPFYSNLAVISPDRALPGTAGAGVSWAFTIIPEAAQENAYPEGSKAAPCEYWNASHASNHYQIFKKTYGVSGSALDDSLEGLNKQRTLALIALAKDINKALITNATYEQRKDETSSGKLGGLYSIFGAHNEIDAGGKELSFDLIEDALEIASLKGLNLDTCYGNGRVLRNLNTLLQDNRRGAFGDTTLVAQNYTRITNLANTTKEVKIVRENMFAQDELVFLLQGNFALIHFRENEKDIQTDEDAVKKQMIQELSLWYDNPYSAVRIKNLKVK